MIFMAISEAQDKGEKHFIPFRNQGQYEDEGLDGIVCIIGFGIMMGVRGLIFSQDPVRLFWR